MPKRIEIKWLSELDRRLGLLASRMGPLAFVGMCTVVALVTAGFLILLSRF